MPILDHLSEEITNIVEFQSFHNSWAVYIAGKLNEVLPRGFRAKPHAQIGSWEVDVRTDRFLTEAEKGKLKIQYQIPTPSATAHITFPTELEIFIVNVSHSTQKIVGVIEIVSKANKDRPQNRDAFVAKCHSILSQGISLIIGDILSVPFFNLHNQLLRVLEISEGKIEEKKEMPLYCSSYRVTFDVNEKPVELVRQTIANPDFIYRSVKARNTNIFYRLNLERGQYQNLYIAIVVRYTIEQGGKVGYVRTAYFTRTPSGGDELLWIKPKR